jgi:hypothetical protein
MQERQRSRSFKLHTESVSLHAAQSDARPNEETLLLCDELRCIGRDFDLSATCIIWRDQNETQDNIHIIELNT